MSQQRLGPDGGEGPGEAWLTFWAVGQLATPSMTTASRSTNWPKANYLIKCVLPGVLDGWGLYLWDYFIGVVGLHKLSQAQLKYLVLFQVFRANVWIFWASSILHCLLPLLDREMVRLEQCLGRDSSDWLLHTRANTHSLDATDLLESTHKIG